MATQTFTVCPDCGEIAEIRDHFVLWSTDGFIEHMRMLCVRGHRFALALASLDRAATPGAPAAAAHPVVGNAS